VVETIRVVIQAEDSPLGRDLEHRIRQAVMGICAQAVVRVSRSAGPGPAKGIAVRVGRRVRILDPCEIVRVQSEDDHCLVFTSDAHHLVRASLTRLEALLDPGCWIRIHRRHLVRVDRLEGWRVLAGGAMVVRLLGQDGEIPVSRSRRGALRALLGRIPVAG